MNIQELSKTNPALAGQVEEYKEYVRANAMDLSDILDRYEYIILTMFDHDPEENEYTDLEDEYEIIKYYLLTQLV